jgi:hypothetical protein
LRQFVSAFGFGSLDDEAWEERSGGEIDGVPVNFYRPLSALWNKEATGRSRDLIDAMEPRKQDRLK